MLSLSLECRYHRFSNILRGVFVCHGTSFRRKRSIYVLCTLCHFSLFSSYFNFHFFSTCVPAFTCADRFISWIVCCCVHRTVLILMNVFRMHTPLGTTDSDELFEISCQKKCKRNKKNLSFFSRYTDYSLTSLQWESSNRIG